MKVNNKMLKGLVSTIAPGFSFDKLKADIFSVIDKNELAENEKWTILITDFVNEQGKRDIGIVLGTYNEQTDVFTQKTMRFNDKVVNVLPLDWEIIDFFKNIKTNIGNAAENK